MKRFILILAVAMAVVGGSIAIIANANATIVGDGQRTAFPATHPSRDSVFPNRSFQGQVGDGYIYAFPRDPLASTVRNMLLHSCYPITIRTWVCPDAPPYYYGS